MINFFADMAKQYADKLPPGLQGLKGEFEACMRLGLEAALQKMQLVPREEFEAQKQVLERTQTLVDKLENRLSQLENHLIKQN